MGQMEVENSVLRAELRELRVDNREVNDELTEVEIRLCSREGASNGGMVGAGEGRMGATEALGNAKTYEGIEIEI